MRTLSVSAAWDETKAILAHDGRLLTTVALALIALPTAVSALVNPRGIYSAATPLWLWAFELLVYVIMLAGQLSLIRLALGPSITVGGAIAHGVRRTPIYVGGLCLVAICLVLLLVLIGLALGALGVPVTGQTTSDISPAGAAGVILFLAVFIYLLVRLVMAAPVADAEPVGPIGVLKRSWQLTEGNWWRLFGFLLTFFVGSFILVLAIGSAVGVAIRLLIGSIDPMSPGALAVALVQALVNAAVTTLLAVMLARIYLQLAGREGRLESSWG